jgi:hypothetical protein
MLLSTFYEQAKADGFYRRRSRKVSEQKGAKEDVGIGTRGSGTFRVDPAKCEFTGSRSHISGEDLVEGRIIETLLVAQLGRCRCWLDGIRSITAGRSTNAVDVHGIKRPAALTSQAV